jgi:hypothetical protein
MSARDHRRLIAAQGALYALRQEETVTCNNIQDRRDEAAALLQQVLERLGNPHGELWQLSDSLHNAGQGIGYNQVELFCYAIPALPAGPR